MRPGYRPEGERCLMRPGSRAEGERCLIRPGYWPEGERCLMRPGCWPEGKRCLIRPECRPKEKHVWWGLGRRRRSVTWWRDWVVEKWGGWEKHSKIGCQPSSFFFELGSVTSYLFISNTSHQPHHHHHHFYPSDEQLSFPLIGLSGCQNPIFCSTIRLLLLYPLSNRALPKILFSPIPVNFSLVIFVSYNRLHLLIVISRHIFDLSFGILLSSWGSLLEFRCHA